MDKKIIFTVISILLSNVVFSAEDTKSATDTEVKDLRFLSEDEKKQWLVKMRSKLPIVKRQRGPFGMLQTIAAPTVQAKGAPVKADAFAKAIKDFKVAVVDPARGKFIIGAREFVVGQVIQVVHENKKFNVQILSVSRNEIRFKDTKTGEIAKHDLKVMPNVFNKPDNKANVEGIRANGGDAPLILNN